MQGDVEDWSRVPTVLGGFDPRQKRYVSITVDLASRQVGVDPLEWFDETYDWGYQQPLSVVAVPGSPLLLFSVQRSSDLVLYDPGTRTVERRVTLADRHGNPRPVFRRTAAALWADDYDTLVRVDPATWNVTDALRLQEAEGATMQFIGEFAFDAREERCVVARPFSADAVVVDTKSFTPLARVALGGQPLDVALLSDGRVIARDWKTGDLLRGAL